jgi:hypothetical protein
MRIGSKSVRSIVTLLIAALLSMQWAAAAHACDALARSAPAGRALVSHDCAGLHQAAMRSVQQLPCSAHCSLDDQSAGALQADLPAWAPYFPSAWYAIAPLDLPQPDGAMSIARDADPPAGAAPIYLVHLCLLN